MVLWILGVGSKRLTEFPLNMLQNRKIDDVHPKISLHWISVNNCAIAQCNKAVLVNMGKYKRNITKNIAKLGKKTTYIMGYTISHTGGYKSKWYFDTHRQHHRRIWESVWWCFARLWNCNRVYIIDLKNKALMNWPMKHDLLSKYKPW